MGHEDFRDGLDDEAVVDTPDRERARLRIALTNARPGELFFVEMWSHEAGRLLPDALRAEGLRRELAYYNLATLPGPQPIIPCLRGFLETDTEIRPEVLFVDGFEAWLGPEARPGDPLEGLNLAREDLTRLGVILVFLVPPHVVVRLRSGAHNLWSWRAHHFVIMDAAPQSIQPISDDLWNRKRPESKESRETRERRVQVLRRVLAEEQSKGRSASTSLSILAPLANDLSALGRHEEAIAVFRPLIDELGPVPEEVVARALQESANTLIAAGKFSEAEKALDTAHTIWLGSSALENLIEGLLARAHIRQKQKRIPDSLRLLREALAMDQRAERSPTRLRPIVLLNLFIGYIEARNPTAAERALKEAIEIEAALSQSKGVLIAELAGRYGVFLLERRRTAEAEPWLRQSIDSYAAEAGLIHPDFLIAVQHLVRLYAASNRFAEWHALAGRALDLAKASDSLPGLLYAQTLQMLAVAEFSIGRFEEGERLSREGLDRCHREALSDHADDLMTTFWLNLGVAFTEQNRLDEAETALRRALALSKIHEHHEKSARYLNIVLKKLGRAEEAPAAAASAVPAVHQRQSKHGKRKHKGKKKH